MLIKVVLKYMGVAFGVDKPKLLCLNRNIDNFFYGPCSFISVSTASEESQVGAIVGGIFAVIVVILIAVAFVILYKRYLKVKNTNQKVTYIKYVHIFSLSYIY